MDASRRIVKRVSLVGLSDGQDEDCYAHVTPINYKEKVANARLDTANMSDDEASAYEEKYVREHFVRGKIRIWNDKGDIDLTDMTADDAVATVEMTDHLYFAIIGVDVDPKAIRETESTPISQPEDKTATETSLSETSSEKTDTTSTSAN